MVRNNKFETLVIMTAVTSLTIVAAIAMSSTPIGGISSTITFVNYAQAQTEVKVSIVPGASTLGDKAFSPNPVNIKIGDTVTWVNDDTVFHTVVSGNPSGGGETGKVFDSGLSGPTALTTKGKTFSHKFTEKGEFPYFCQLHPSMIGKVIVS
jgi:plastocyanin